MYLLKTLVYKWRKCSLNVWNNNLKKLQLNERNILLKESRIATKFVQNFKDFQAKFGYLTNVHPGQFSKIHLSSDLFQNKTIVVGFSKILVCF